MLYHVSRRTDVPACYWEWFLRRLDAGYALVRNPRYAKSVSRYDLTPDVCDGFAFLSKDYGPAIQGVRGLMTLEEIIETYRITNFSCTVTPYISLERGLRPLEERVRAIEAVSALAGRERMRWLFAPILVTDDMDITWQLRFLEEYVPRLAAACATCYPDDLHVYDHVSARLKANRTTMRNVEGQERDDLFGRLAELSREHGLDLVCYPSTLSNWEAYGVRGAPCASRETLGRTNDVRIVRGARETCGSVTVDV